MPDDDHLFMRVHRDEWETAQHRPKIGAFRFRTHAGYLGGTHCMSTNWAQLCPDPEHTRELASLGNPTKDPRHYGVVALDVGKVRAIELLDVIHTPNDDVECHCDVTAERKPPKGVTDVRNELFTIAREHTALLSPWLAPIDPNP